MHLHLPKPLHGWREFAGEVGIIVIGVLIALGAEQVVEDWRWRTHVAEAKEDLASELYQALYASRERATGQNCFDRKLDRLGALIEQPQRRRLPGDVEIAPIRAWSTSAWDSAIASEAVTHMKPDDRTQYARVYSLIRTTRDLNLDEFKTASQLDMLQRDGSLNEQSKDRLLAAVAELRGYNRLLGLIGGQLSTHLHELGITLQPEDELTIIGRHCRMPDEPDRGLP